MATPHAIGARLASPSRAAARPGGLGASTRYRKRLGHPHMHRISPSGYSSDEAGREDTESDIDEEQTR